MPLYWRLQGNPADIFYLTGFFCSDSLLLYGAEPILVTDGRYAVAAEVMIWDAA